MSFLRAALATLLLPALLGAGAARAADAATTPGPDIHELFESRCLRCHGHAGPFARERLSIVEGEVRGKGGRDLRPFLARHGGGLTPDETDRLLAAFSRQIESGGLFQEKCGICHTTARDLARLNLIERDGTLTGRYTGRDIGKFLLNHGRLMPDEAASMTEALTAILQGGR